MKTPNTCTPAQARAILGENFLGLEEVRKGYGIALDPERFAEIPYSEATLRAYKDTHVLVAGAALSRNEIRKLADSDFCRDDWYTEEAFANHKKVDVRWYLLRKEPVPESHSKTYDEQRALLKDKDEEVPLACEVAYMVILYWLTHNKKLLTNVYVRCRDMGWLDNRVIVGFDAGGFRVIHYWGDRNTDGRLGLASSVTS